LRRSRNFGFKIFAGSEFAWIEEHSRTRLRRGEGVPPEWRKNVLLIEAGKLRQIKWGEVGIINGIGAVRAV
jgi:hypothetical protein